jgi:hypothetical protein
MSIYDGIDPAVLQARLSEAQDAYHALAVGGQTVSVKLGDKAVAYTAADLDKLGRYIRELQGALGLSTAPRGFYIGGGKGV